MENFNIRTFNCKYSNGKIYIPDAKWALKGSFAMDIEVKKNPQKRVYFSLNKNYLTSFKIIPDGNYLKAPGSSIKLAITKTYDNSNCEILKDRKKVVNFLQKCFLYVNGSEYKNGSLNINDDIYKIYNHRAGFIAISNESPFLGDTFEFSLDYIKNYNYYVNGWDGINGFSAKNGKSGFSGDSGENGGNGTEGGNGRNGSYGYMGQDLIINFDKFYDTIINTDLCIVEVINEEDHSLVSYLINPKGGSITFFSNGGKGGNGGNGGNGGKGGNGGASALITKIKTKTIKVTDTTGSHTKVVVDTIKVQIPGGRGGNGGRGGDGGDGGNGGNGGNIYIYYTDSAVMYLGCIIIQNFGGNGGFPGYGGNGGSGGKGGSGDPAESNGRSGNNGNSGNFGLSGNDGKIHFYRMEERTHMSDKNTGKN